MYRADLVNQIKTARKGLEELPDLRRVELGSGENLGILVERGPAPSKKSSATVDKGAGAGELVVEENLVEIAVSDKEEEKMEGNIIDINIVYSDDED